VADINIRLAVQGQPQTRAALRGTADDADRLDGALGRIGRSGLDAARGLASISGRALGAGVRGVATGAGLLAAGLTSVAAAGAVVGIKTAASMEQANISFTTMLGSGQAAQDFLTNLNKFANATPFDFPGLTTAASSLISAGIDANKVIPIMTSLGNATSGMGTGAEGVQRATVALQQMNAAGKISGEDLNQLRDAGVPVFDLLTAATGKSTAAIADMAQKGKLGRKELDQLMAALESGKGLERFNGLMEKQSQSLSGMASTLKDTVGMGLSQAFQPAIPFLKILLTDTNTLIGRALPGITTGVGKVTAGLQGLYEIFAHSNYDGILSRTLGIEEDSAIVDKLFRIREAAVAAFTYLSTTAKNIDWATVWAKLAGAIDWASNAFRGVKTALAGVNFASISAELQSFGQAAGDSSVWADSLRIGATLLGTALGFLSDHAGTIIKWMPAIVAGFAAWKIAQQALLVIEIARIPLLAAQVAGTFATAAATTAYALANVYAANALLAMNGITRDCLILRLKDAIVANAQAAATIAVSVASKVAAAGQWLWNAAMTANPIGLVIAAIALLVGGVILAYQKSETFRGIVDGLWGALKVAGAWIRDSLWPIIQNVLVTGIDNAKRNFDNIKASVGGFVDKIKDAWNWVKKLGDQLKDSAIGQALGAVGGAVGSVFGGGRATGGPVSAGTTYLVGEQGPELYTASRSGSIINHETLAAAADTSGYGLLAEDVASMGRPIHTHVYLNSREIATAVSDVYSDTVARS